MPFEYLTQTLTFLFSSAHLACLGTQSEMRAGNAGWESSHEVEVGFLDGVPSLEKAKLEKLQRC